MLNYYLQLFNVCGIDSRYLNFLMGGKMLGVISIMAHTQPYYLDTEHLENPFYSICSRWGYFWGWIYSWILILAKAEAVGFSSQELFTHTSAQIRNTDPLKKRIEPQSLGDVDWSKFKSKIFGADNISRDVMYNLSIPDSPKFLLTKTCFSVNTL